MNIDLFSGHTVLGIPLLGGRLITVEALYVRDPCRSWLLELRLNPDQYHLLTFDEACWVIQMATWRVEQGVVPSSY